MRMLKHVGIKGGRFCAIISSVALVGVASRTFADSIVVDGVTWNYTVNGDGSTVTLNGVNGNKQAQTANPSFDAAHIPWTFTNNDTSYTVTSFAEKLFQGWSNLTGELTIPGTVKGTLGVFQGCNGLTRLTLEEGLEEFPWYIFKNCKYIAGGVIVPSTVTTIPGGSFSWDQRITAAWIKGGATADAKTKFNVRSAFYGGQKLKFLLFGKNTQGEHLNYPDTLLDNDANGCVVYVPDNGGWGKGTWSSNIGGNNTVLRYYGPGCDVDIATDDQNNIITVSPTTAETLQEALGLAPVFKSALGLDMKVSITNRIATVVTIPDAAYSSVMFDLHSWVTFKVETQQQLENTLASISADSMVIIDPDDATETLTVPEGRQVFVLMKEGDKIRIRPSGLVLYVK